jgi:peptidyl-prolyl cis-trans isomerase D
MATLNKLRNSKIVLIVVLISLGLFVASDYFSNSNKYSFGSSQVVGEIDGHDITYQEFDVAYKDFLDKMEKNGTPETEQSKEQASSYAWEEFMQKYIVNKQYDKLGIDVSPDEAGMLLYSETPHQYVQQYFSQFSEDGIFRPANVIKAKNMGKKDPNVKQFFDNIANEVFKAVMNRKYTSLITKSLYATKLDEEDDYYSSQTTVTGKAVALNFSTIEDKSIKISDSDLEDYIKKHKSEFKQEDSRDIEYVLFNIAPSKEDTLTLKDELKSEIPNFASTKEDSLFTVVNGIQAFDPAYKSRGGFNPAVEQSLFSATKDSVIGPLYYDGGYSIFKVTDIKMDSLATYHAIKSEVIVKGATKKDTTDAIAAAKKVALESKGTANTLEFLNSKTDILSYSYDMGWFKEGSQEPEVNKALKAIGSNNATVIKGMSRSGLSLITLVEPPSNKSIQVAEVRRMIAPLKSSEDAAFQKAMDFRNSLTGAKGEFEAKSQKAKVSKSIANNVKESEKAVSNLPGTQEVVRWAFAKERKEGDYTDVISTDYMLMVAHMVKIKKEGTAKVDDVREKVTALVMNEKKAEILKESFNKAMSSGKSIEDIAGAVKSTVVPIERASFQIPGLQFAAGDGKLVGFVCGMKAKELSKPVVGKEGVYVFYVDNITKPAAEKPEEVKMRQQYMFGQQKQQAYNMAYEGLKKIAKVKDERFRFY